MENKAINLFKSAYGKTPEEAGFSVIDFDEEKNVFLYADSKKQQGPARQKHGHASPSYCTSAVQGTDA